jgi:hypothetical protein
VPITCSFWVVLKKKALNTRYLQEFLLFVVSRKLTFFPNTLIAINLTVDHNKNLEILTGHPLKRMKFSRNHLSYSFFNYLDCFCPEELYPVCVMGLPRAHHAEGIRLGQQVSIDQVLTAADTPQFYTNGAMAGSIRLVEKRCPSS